MGWSRERLAKVAARTGYPVHAAWVTGHGTMGEIMGCILHHTATPNSYMASADIPTLKILREGRSDLAGPLCNFGLARSGAIWLITDGLGWHAGAGAYRGVTLGATHFLGIEAENGGRGVDKDPWPEAQLDSYHRLVASILYEKGDTTTTWDIRHATWALPAGRKTDTAGFNMTQFDSVIQHLLDHPDQINKNTTTPPVEDDMPFTEKQLRDIVSDEVRNALGAGDDGWVNADALLPPGSKPDAKITPLAMILQSYVKLSAQLKAMQAADADDATLAQIATLLNDKLGSGAQGQLTKADVEDALTEVFGRTQSTTS